MLRSVLLITCVFLLFESSALGQTQVPPAENQKVGTRPNGDALEPPPLQIAWKDNYLNIAGGPLPPDGMKVHYLEAYCRPGSTNRLWQETVIGHQTRLVNQPGPSELRLECALKDGVKVTHHILATADEVQFALVAHNPTTVPSAAHWAQPCIRVDTFTGLDQTHYVRKCFIVQEGKIVRLPTQPWSAQARYVPGQVYRPAQVPADDVNPRPVSRLLAENGIAGVYSADESTIMATVWEPYQELFQGVGVCMHTDFRLGGLAAGETKEIRGKIYVVPADEPRLLARIAKDFPEQFPAAK